MNVYTHTKFSGHYPIGTAAVVVAENKRQAAKLLSTELAKRGLPQEIDLRHLERLFTTKNCVVVLRDGDY